MSNVIPFEFNARAVRVIDIEGEPWFVAKDVADLLGYSNPSRSVNDHCKAVQMLKATDSVVLDVPARGLQIIPERDVYRLVMRSKMPEAEQFEEWVVGTVLPSVRKTGGYGKQAIDFNDPAQLRSYLLQATEEIERRDHQIAELTPKAVALDRLSGSDGSLCITNAAKDLQLRPKDLFAHLSRERWIYKRTGSPSWTAYQDKLQQGLLEHKTTTVTRTDGSEKITEQVRITPKGLAKLARVFADGRVA